MLLISERKKIFVEEYIRRRCKDQKGAAMAAGYSEKSASSHACRMLGEPDVAAYLEMRLAELRTDLRKEFLYDAIEARKQMYAIMIDPYAKDTDKIMAAKDFLDRAGFKAGDSLDVHLEGAVIFEGMNDVKD